MWYTFVGTATTILIAGFCSIFFGINDPQSVPSELLTPCIRSLFSKKAVEERGKSGKVRKEIYHIKKSNCNFTIFTDSKYRRIKILTFFLNNLKLYFKII